MRIRRKASIARVWKVAALKSWAVCRMRQIPDIVVTEECVVYSRISMQCSSEEIIRTDETSGREASMSVDWILGELWESAQVGHIQLPNELSSTTQEFPYFLCEWRDDFRINQSENSWQMISNFACLAFIVLVGKVEDGRGFCSVQAHLKPLR